MSIVKINVSSPLFQAIKKGQKTVEGRLYLGKFKSIVKGMQFEISNPKVQESKPLLLLIENVVHYTSFEHYLVQEGLRRTLPGIKSIEKGIETYRQFYSIEKEKEHGVVAFHICLFNHK